MKSLRTLLADRSGATVIEFAFTFPMTVMLILGGIDLGYQYVKRAMLEGAIRDAARTAITKTVGCSAERSTKIASIVEEALKPFTGYDGGTATVSVKAYGSDIRRLKPEPLTRDVDGDGEYDPDVDAYEDLNGDGQWTEDMGTPNSYGHPGDVVVYSTTYTAKSFFLFLPILNGPETIQLSASTVVRNEPYECDAPASTETSGA